MKIFIVLVLALAGCSKCGPAGAPDAGFKRGKCFGKAGHLSCAIDANCGGTEFVTCQEGICCSGKLDPNDCTCHCGDGAACTPGKLCCPGACSTAPKLGVLMCRQQDDCFPCGPL